MPVVEIAERLRDATAALRFGAPVAFTYRPLTYAWEAHRRYVERYARRGIEALFVGMNPGPFGMAQTGVPFGEVAAVRDFLGIEVPIAAPKGTHPKRPVEGFACTRSEVSGRRVWGWVRDRFGTADAFADRFFIWNWCPLAFVTDTGANLTPDKLPAASRSKLDVACDSALQAIVAELRPRLVIGFGTFAAARARAALGPDGPAIGSVLHPSPASPAANRGWVPAVELGLAQLGISVDGSRRDSASAAKPSQSSRKKSSGRGSSLVESRTTR
ncbi:MAG: single-stranded DNA-binding protein [Phycisphaerae bacterium]|nr:single-stranded DNA-binding protein [Phycisphaerae bacterium]